MLLLPNYTVLNAQHVKLAVASCTTAQHLLLQIIHAAQRDHPMLKALPCMQNISMALSILLE